MSKGRLHHYYVRVYDEQGKPLSTRGAEARGPREACREAFGVVYDGPDDTCRVCDVGTRSPKYLSRKALDAILDNPANWKRVPHRPGDIMWEARERAQKRAAEEAKVEERPEGGELAPVREYTYTKEVRDETGTVIRHVGQKDGHGYWRDVPEDAEEIDPGAYRPLEGIPLAEQPNADDFKMHFDYGE